MQSIDLIRENLRRSAERTLLRIEDMAAHPMVPPTPLGGGHTLWVLGHLAYIEGLVIHRFALGGDNPLAEWEALFDGAEVSAAPGDYPPFDAVLARCRAMREETIAVLGSFSEADLDLPAGHTPKGFEDIFGTRRLCFQYVADHWYMHRGQLADCRRAAGMNRMWL